MERIALKAELRDIANKHALKTLRKEGKVPSVFYGHNEKNQHITVNAKEIEKLLHSGVGRNVLIDLDIAGKGSTVLMKEIQRDIFTQNPIHIDFQAISMKEKIELKVPIRVVGTAPGVKNSGGILENIVHEVTVECLPTDIPKYIEIDVSTLEMGHGLTVADLKKPEGVDILLDKSVLVVNVVAPTKIEEVAPAVGEGEVAVAAAATAATSAEPEVIKKGKKDEEEVPEAGAKAKPDAGAKAKPEAKTDKK